MNRLLSQKQPDPEALAVMRKQRCEKCEHCKTVEASKSLLAPNPPFDHANQATVDCWNKVLADNPCQGRWYCYQNEDLSHPQLGHMQFLQCGPGNTFKEPPKRYPDTPSAIGWRYLLAGVVDLASGDILALK